MAAVIPLQNPDLFSGTRCPALAEGCRKGAPRRDMFASLVSSYEIIYFVRACTAKLHLKVLDDGGIGYRIAIFQEQASAVGWSLR